MALGRRAFFRVIGGGIFAVSGASLLLRTAKPSQAQSGLELRKVRLDDAEQLRSIMNSCVSDADSFHGKCNPWSVGWAEIATRRHPETVVITLDGSPVAFQEIPSIRQPIVVPAADAPKEEWEKYELRERSRRTYRLVAAGVSEDLVGPEESVQMFRRVLFYGFASARAQGFEYVDGFFPWELHPKMPRPWTDYPGCELLGHSANQEGGPDVYWLRWRLDDAIHALSAEGADDAALDLA